MANSVSFEDEEVDSAPAVRRLATLAANARTFERELAWLSAVIEARLAECKTPGSDPAFVPSAAQSASLEPPDLDDDSSMYASFVRHYEMALGERLAVVLALTPRVRPEVLDVLFRTNPLTQRGHTELGGVQGKMHGGFLPTGETVVFLLSGRDLTRRFGCQQLFERDHFFAQHNLLRLDVAPVGEPPLSGQLLITDEVVDLVTTGERRKPDYSRDFPAHLLRTEMRWDDLVLHAPTLTQLRELEAWIRHEDVLMNEWGLGRRLRPGYRCLFYGPPGTGKTLTANLLGKRLQRDVYRIALSAVVSKYIGETEKNLERVFSRAEAMNCILFFDEADALFGKRTSVTDAHDRYANQEVSYLLQRIEDFSGVVILASNFGSNIDEAFMRRFQAVVKFPMPGAREREQLWSACFSGHCELDEKVSLKDLASKYELSGGAIMNVIRFASLMAIERGGRRVLYEDIITGIRREMQKDGKTL
jgi:hypothetical protein